MPIICTNSVPLSGKTQRVSFTKINWLLLFREILAIYLENDTKPTNTLCGQMQLLNIQADRTCIVVSTSF
jgi:hypothetical protein